MNSFNHRGDDISTVIHFPNSIFCYLWRHWSGTFFIKLSST